MPIYTIGLRFYNKIMTCRLLPIGHRILRLSYTSVKLGRPVLKHSSHTGENGVWILGYVIRIIRIKNNK